MKKITESRSKGPSLLKLLLFHKYILTERAGTKRRRKRLKRKEIPKLHCENMIDELYVIIRKEKKTEKIFSAVGVGVRPLSDKK